MHDGEFKPANKVIKGIRIKQIVKFQETSLKKANCSTMRNLQKKSQATYVNRKKMGTINQDVTINDHFDNDP